MLHGMETHFQPPTLHDASVGVVVDGKLAFSRYLTLPLVFRPIPDGRFEVDKEAFDATWARFQTGDWQEMDLFNLWACSGGKDVLADLGRSAASGIRRFGIELPDASFAITLHFLMKGIYRMFHAEAFPASLDPALTSAKESVDEVLRDTESKQARFAALLEEACAAAAVAAE